MDQPPTRPSAYATIQVRRHVKDQINDYCNKKGLKISRFIERVFLQAVSGSSNSAINFNPTTDD